MKITDAGQSEDLQARRVTELSQEVALADSRSNEAKALVDQLREANFTAGALPSAIQSAVLSGLRADYARLTREAADRETVLGARHPDVIATQAQLGDVRRQIAAEKDRLVALAKADYLEARKRRGPRSPTNCARRRPKAARPTSAPSRCATSSGRRRRIRRSTSSFSTDSAR